MAASRLTCQPSKIIRSRIRTFSTIWLAHAPSETERPIRIRLGLEVKTPEPREFLIGEFDKCLRVSGNSVTALQLETFRECCDVFYFLLVVCATLRDEVAEMQKRYRIHQVRAYCSCATREAPFEPPSCRRRNRCKHACHARWRRRRRACNTNTGTGHTGSTACVE